MDMATLTVFLKSKRFWTFVVAAGLRYFGITDEASTEAIVAAGLVLLPILDKAIENARA